MNRIAAIVALAGVAVASASASIVKVEVNGTVDYNFVGGGHANVQAGDAVSMSFLVDSENYVNSASFPTRGYTVDLASFEMTVGSSYITLDNPQPFGPAYFVVRNNDPVADGFMLSRNIDFPQDVQVHVPGLTPTHDLHFLATYGSSDTIPSLDILDAVGTYDLNGISVYGWYIGRFGGIGAEYAYESITISVVPAPATLALLVPLAAARRRR